MEALPAMKRLRKMLVERSFKTCPACDYTEGFHVVFSQAREKGKYCVYLICPMCSASYDIGLRCEKVEKEGTG